MTATKNYLPHYSTIYHPVATVDFKISEFKDGDKEDYKGKLRRYTFYKRYIIC